MFTFFISCLFDISFYILLLFILGRIVVSHWNSFIDNIVLIITITIIFAMIFFIENKINNLILMSEIKPLLNRNNTINTVLYSSLL